MRDADRHILARVAVADALPAVVIRPRDAATDDRPLDAAAGRDPPHRRRHHARRRRSTTTPATSLFRRFDEARRSAPTRVILKLNTLRRARHRGAGHLAVPQAAGRPAHHRVRRREGDLRRRDDRAGVRRDRHGARLARSATPRRSSIAPGGGLQTLGRAERAKAESPILADFYDSAVENGYDPLLAEAMVAVGRVVHWVENGAGDAATVRRRAHGNTARARQRRPGWKPVDAGVPQSDRRAPTRCSPSHADVAQKLGLATAIVADAAGARRARAATTIVADLVARRRREVRRLARQRRPSAALLLIVFMLSLYIAPAHPRPRRRRGDRADQRSGCSSASRCSPATPSGGRSSRSSLGLCLLAVETLRHPRLRRRRHHAASCCCSAGWS